MIRTVSIVPTVLSDNKQEYREQIEPRRVQIDVTDGTFAPTMSLDITAIWWPKNWEADLHLMTATPSEYLDTILKLSPSLCILPAEANALRASSTDEAMCLSCPETTMFPSSLTRHMNFAKTSITS